MSARAPMPDGEVVELLADEPELLAIADAVAATQRPARRRRLPARRLALLAALVTAAGVATFAAPGGDDSSGLVVAHALAALGTGPVVHATIETRLDATRVVDLTTGSARRPVVRIEYWFDERLRRLRTVVRHDGVVTRESLQTTAGTTTSGGPIRSAGGQPALDPALGAFVTGYRDALARGRARLSEGGTVDGRRVVWLELTAGGARERVAVDEETHAPLVVLPLRPSGEPGLTWRVLRVETIARSARDFRPVGQAPTPFRGDVRASEPISAAAAQSLAWEAVWLGRTWRDLRLVAFEREELSRGYAPGTRSAAQRGEGLRLRYAVDGGAAFVEISQAPRPEPAYAFTAGPATFGGNPVPAEGSAELVEVGSGPDRRWLAQLRAGGAYVSVWASTRALCLEAARALRPLAP